MWVYLYQNNSELAMKNAYIGEYQEWYKYLRWTITANRDNVSIVQMSEKCHDHLELLLWLITLEIIMRV